MSTVSKHYSSTTFAKEALEDFWHTVCKDCINAHCNYKSNNMRIMARSASLYDIECQSFQRDYKSLSVTVTVTTTTKDKMDYILRALEKKEH